jgi:hypothetical protein
MEEITDLNFTPKLKELLIEYCYMQYEEFAIIDEHHLMMEHELLIRTNKLNELFELEYFQNKLRYDFESRPHCG